MSDLLGSFATDMLDLRSLIGAAFLGLLCFGIATVVVVLIRRATRRMAVHLTDVTALQFVSALAQAVTYVIGFVIYANVVPALRVVGTTLLAGVSVVSVVVGLAAQNTLGNLIAGFSLVLYRTIRIGDRVRVPSPGGALTATVEVISLGFTKLRDDDGNEVIVPNSVMMGSTIIRLRRSK